MKEKERKISQNVIIGTGVIGMPKRQNNTKRRETLNLSFQNVQSHFLLVIRDCDIVRLLSPDSKFLARFPVLNKKLCSHFYFQEP